MPFDATLSYATPVATHPTSQDRRTRDHAMYAHATIDRATLREMHATLLRRAGHLVAPRDAADLVQDTWLAALGGLERFEGRASLLTWLTSILRHKAADRFRSARHRRELLVSFESCEPSAEGRVVEILGARAALDRVGRSLAAMEPRARTLVLAEVEGDDDREHLAREHGVTRETYRVQLCRARAHLRASLAA